MAFLISAIVFLSYCEKWNKDAEFTEKGADTRITYVCSAIFGDLYSLYLPSFSYEV